MASALIMVLFFYKKKLNGGDFQPESCEKVRFEECTIHGCDLTEVSFRQAQLLQTRFENCQLSLNNIEGCRLQEVEFRDCKLAGIGFHTADPGFFSVSTLHSVLLGCNFSDCLMKNVSLRQSKIKECHFTGTQLQGADFTGSDLSGSLFHHCDLSKADFRDAVGYWVDPLANKIKGAKFCCPEALVLLEALGVCLV